MAGTDGTYPSQVPGLASDSEEVSTFLNQLLHDSPSSSMTSKIKSLPPPWFSLQVGVAGFAHLEGPLENPQMFGLFGSESGSDNLIKIGKSLDASNAVIDSSSSFNFSDPYGYLQAEVKDVAENEFCGTGVEDCDADTSLKENRIWPENNSSDFISRVENKEGSELPSKQVPPRFSSKRSRSADVHNMSEKRRRRRINEKMKSLQNLIPNSNKTDKASMLDDAIEYLKQLQLQVQMLTMKNGLSLHPMSLPGTLQPMTSPQIALSLYDGNGTQKLSNGIASSVNAETLVQPSFIKHSTSPNQYAVLPLVSNITTSGYSQ